MFFVLGEGRAYPMILCCGPLWGFLIFNHLNRLVYNRVLNLALLYLDRLLVLLSAKSGISESLKMDTIPEDPGYSNTAARRKLAANIIIN